MKKPCPKAGPEVRLIQFKFPGKQTAPERSRESCPRITLLTKTANTNAGQCQAKVRPAMSHLLD
jgi:hypothetical protein